MVENQAGSSGFSLLGNGFQNNANEDDLTRIASDGSFAVIERRKNASGGAVPGIPTVDLLPGQTSRCGDVVDASSNNRQSNATPNRPRLPSWTRSQKNPSESPSSEVRTSSRTSQRQGAAFKCGIHKGQCACWKHERDYSDRGAAGNGHEYVKSKFKRKPKEQVFAETSLSPKALKTTPVGKGRRSEPRKSSSYFDQPETNNEEVLREQKSPDHCYAISVNRVNAGDSLRVVVGMDHNYCTPREESKLTEEAPVESLAEVDESLPLTSKDKETPFPNILSTLARKDKSSKRRGRKRKDRSGDGDDCGDNRVPASDPSLQDTSPNSNVDDSSRSPLPLGTFNKKERMKKKKLKRDKGKLLLKKALQTKSFLKSVPTSTSSGPLPLVEGEDSDLPPTPPSMFIDEDSAENAETSTAEFEEQDEKPMLEKEVDKRKAADVDVVKSEVAFPKPDPTVKKPDRGLSPVTPAEPVVEDESRIGARRWSHLPRAAKRKRLKKFQAMLKAEKSKAGYLSLSTYSDSDEDSVKQIEQRKKTLKKPSEPVASTPIDDKYSVHSVQSEESNFSAQDSVNLERLREERDRLRTQALPVGVKVEAPDSSSRNADTQSTLSRIESEEPHSSQSSIEQQKHRNIHDHTPSTEHPIKSPREKQRQLLLCRISAGHIDSTQTQKMVANLTKMGLLTPGKTITVNEVKRGNKRRSGDVTDKSISKKIRLVPNKESKPGGGKSNVKPKVSLGPRGVKLNNGSFVKELKTAKKEAPPLNAAAGQGQCYPCYFCCRNASLDSCSSAKEQLFNERLLAVCPRLAKESRSDFDIVCRPCLDSLVKLEDTFYDMGERRRDEDPNLLSTSGTAKTMKLPSPREEAKKTKAKIEADAEVVGEPFPGEVDAVESNDTNEEDLKTRKQEPISPTFTSCNPEPENTHSTPETPSIPVAVKSEPKDLEHENVSTSQPKTPRPSDEGIPLVFASNNNNLKIRASPPGVNVKCPVKRMEPLLSGSPSKNKVWMMKPDGSVAAPADVVQRAIEDPVSSSASVFEVHPVRTHNPQNTAHLYLSHKYIIAYFISDYLDHLLEFFCREKGLVNDELAQDRIRRVLARYHRLNDVTPSNVQTTMDAFLNCQVDLGSVNEGNSVTQTKNRDATKREESTTTVSADKETTRLKKELRFLSKRCFLLLRSKAEDMQRYQSEVVTVMRRCVKEAKDISTNQSLLASYAIQAKSSFKALLSLYRTDVEILRTIVDEGLKSQRLCNDPICPHRRVLEHVKWETKKTLKSIATQNGPVSLLKECLDLQVSERCEEVEEEEDEEESIDGCDDEGGEGVDVVEAESSRVASLEEDASSVRTTPFSADDGPVHEDNGDETVTDGLNLLCAAMEGDLRHEDNPR